MKKLNPIEESNFINDEFKEYLKDTFHFNNIEYQKYGDFSETISYK